MNNQQSSNILHILTSQAWGGLELYVLSLLRKQLDNRLNIALYCIKNSKVDKEAKKLGIPTYYAHKQARFSPKDIFNVKHILNKNNYNVIHAHTRQDVWLGAFVKILSNANHFIYSLYMSAPSKKDILHRFIYKQIDAITSSSQILNERIKKNYPVLPEKVHLLRYGRDQERLEKNIDEVHLIRKLWNTKKENIVFATLCRIDSGKGVREIAESLNYLSKETLAKIKIWIIGEPTLLYTDADGNPVYEEQSCQLYSWLKEFVKKSEGKIELIPFQKNPRPYFEAMDVFVLGTYKETYSLSVLDAMSVGTPVIGTNSGGTPEQIKHEERGLLIEPKDPKAIALAMETYVNNKELIKKHGKAAQNWVTAEHNWQNTIIQITKLYHL